MIGGGVIGMELATVYAALGARVTVVELTDGLLPGCDRDLVKPLAQRVASRYEAVLLGTRVSAAQARDDGIHVSFDGPQAPGPQVYDQVLVAAGRRPNGAAIDAERAGARVDEGGFIRVDAQQRTNVGHIYAIGDVVGEPMLAHKAAHEGKVAAETAAGMRVANDARVIPAVAYTDPEVAWVGLTETAAQRDGIAYEKAAFPWAASGRALSLGRGEGLTKILVDPATHALLGVGMVGPQARRPDRRGRAGHRDGRRTGRHRADHTPASDLVRNPGLRGRGVRGNAYRVVPDQEKVKYATGPRNSPGGLDQWRHGITQCLRARPCIN